MFQFTIRDVLWLTVVVALSAGWWLDHTRFSQEDLKAMQEVKKKKASAYEVFVEKRTTVYRKVK